PVGPLVYHHGLRQDSYCALSAMLERLKRDFFFQAEDGIRDLTVTGVQTCALPIYRLDVTDTSTEFYGGTTRLRYSIEGLGQPQRSEERRVGKECRCPGGGHDGKNSGIARRDGLGRPRGIDVCGGGSLALGHVHVAQ